MQNLYLLPKLNNIQNNGFVFIIKRNCIMSPEQLKQLKELSDVFNYGSANSSHIKQLSLLLTEINFNKLKSNIVAESFYP
jgi:hypothetical protein